MTIIRTISAGFLSIFFGIVANQALAADDVLTPLKTIYQGDLMRDEEPFSKRLAELYDAAVKRSAELEAPVSGLDFDYAINGQDFEDGLLATVVYDVTSETADTAAVTVTFKNFDVQMLDYRLIKTDGLWLVDDVKCLSPDCNWVLSDLYKEGAAQTE